MTQSGSSRKPPKHIYGTPKRTGNSSPVRLVPNDLVRKLLLGQEWRYKPCTLHNNGPQVCTIDYKRQEYYIIPVNKVFFLFLNNELHALSLIRHAFKFINEHVPALLTRVR